MASSKAASSVSRTADKKELSTNNFIAVVAVVTLLVVIIAGFAAKQLVGQVALNNKVLSKKTAANKQLEQNLEAVDSLERNYALLGDQAKKVLNALPTKPEFPLLISMLEVMAGTSGVRMASISTPDSTTEAAQATPSAGQPEEFKFTINVTGSYDNLQRFLKSVELSARPMRVNALILKGSGQAIDASIDITTYYQGAVDLSEKEEVIK